MQLDKSNTTAQSKLAMVKDLFNPPAKTAPMAVASAEPVKAAPASTAATKTEPLKPNAASTTASVKTEPVKTVPAVAVAGNGKADAQISAAVQSWAKSWAAKDVPGYLASYAADFETPDGLTRAAWETQRKERIERPKSISVEVKISKVSVKGDEATVTFRQAYRSDAVKSNNTKTLKMVRSGDKWLIRSERAGS